MEPNKSSINFLLADRTDSNDYHFPGDNKQNKQHKSHIAEEPDELMVVVPRTTSAAIPIKQKKRLISRPKHPKLSLEIIQQPKNAKVSTRASGRVFSPFSEHRPIHPPPVLQLKVEGFNPSHEGAITDDLITRIKKSHGNKSTERIQELELTKKMRENRVPPWTHYSTFFVTARLRCAKDQSEKLLFHNQLAQSVDELLIGNDVASGMPLSLKMNSSSSNKQLNHLLPMEKTRAHNYGIVFVFPDLSVRKVGLFNIKFDLFEVYAGKVHWRSEVISDEIQIYTPKKFPGSTLSSPLTSFLYRRGARIRQRKRTSSKRQHGEDDEEEEEEEDDDYDRNHSSSESPMIRTNPKFPSPSSSQKRLQRMNSSIQMGSIYSHSISSKNSSSSSTPYQPDSTRLYNAHPQPLPPTSLPHTTQPHQQLYPQNIQHSQQQQQKYYHPQQQQQQYQQFQHSNPPILPHIHPQYINPYNQPPGPAPPSVVYQHSSAPVLPYSSHLPYRVPPQPLPVQNTVNYPYPPVMLAQPLVYGTPPPPPPPLSHPSRQNPGQQRPEHEPR